MNASVGSLIRSSKEGLWISKLVLLPVLQCDNCTEY